MFIDEPIFFSPKPTKLNRKLFKGTKGGDGGAAERKAAEDARIATAIKKLNEVFGLADPLPEAIDKAKFTKNIAASAPNNGAIGLSGMANIGGINGNTNTSKQVFDEAGYISAVAASKAKADALKGSGAARENLYKKIGTDATNTALLDLNKERGITERDLNFSLARNGLSGGSRDIDANKDVLDTYQQGVLKASNIGLQTGNNARSNDEKTRVNLINSIHAGLSDGDATAQAYAAMSNNAKSAADDANNASLAGFFDVLKQQQAQAQYNQGVNSVPTVTPYQQAKNATSATKSYGGKSGSF
jgi:hypothetical protein